MISHINYPELTISNRFDFRSSGISSFQPSNIVGTANILHLKLSGYGNNANRKSYQNGNILELDCFETAKSHLLHLINTRQLLPKIIVYEGRIRFMQLKQFYAFLQLHDALKFIPLVYNHGNEGVFDNEELYQMVRSKLFDNVVGDINNEQSILDSAEVLSSLKRVRLENNVNYTPTTISSGSNKSIDLFFKRFIDILVSSLLLAFLAPLMIFIALLIYLESRGPIFYISKRAGKCFDVFDFYKFRTMVINADEKLKEYQQLNKYFTEENRQTKKPQFFKLKNDPRVTRMGSFLRRTSLDELPQLFNVLKGDMSLVGNRPLPLYEAATLTSDECAERFIAPAGITGLWQITKRGKESMSVEERVGLDIEYSRKFSFLFDLKIIARTPKAMFQE